MMNSHVRNACAGASALALALLSSGCNPGAGGASGGVTTTPGNNPSLVSVEVGRLVDVYAYRIVDPNGDTDRRAVGNRAPVLIQSDVVIDPRIETDPLFDVTGAASADADYRFLPFDVQIGHDELIILWDDRQESTEFSQALASAQRGLIEVTPAFRGQNVLTSPIPVVPRNGAFKLTFSSGLGLDSTFFTVNPQAIQLLLFEDDPDVVGALAAFRPTSVRTIAQDNVVILDTTVLGAETATGLNPSDGLDASVDQVTANYRIAIPTDGVASALLSVQPDSNPVQNRIDFRGDAAVIRDVRTGNVNDGAIGSLADFERPQIVAKRDMGIVSVDPATRQVVVAKRGQNFALRGRVPFVDGELFPTGTPGVFRPGGPTTVPTVDTNGLRFPLPSGDFITQTVVSPSGESVTIRAEIIGNLDVGRITGDVNFAAPGLTAGGTDGGELVVQTLQLSTVEAVDSQGNTVRFASAPDVGMGMGGATCSVQVRYYESVPYATGGFTISDSARRGEFITVDPIASVDQLVGADPMVNVGVQFNEPVDFERLSPSDNFVLTNSIVDGGNFQDMLASPKSSTLNMVVTELVDQNSDGTDLRLRAPEGLFHENGSSEIYWFHVDIENDAVADFAGNPLQIFDLRSPGQTTTTSVGGLTLTPGVVSNVPLESFSVPFALDSTASDNIVGWQIKRFADLDEDGSVNGALDFFGQFQVIDGELRAAPTARRSLTADETANGINPALGEITRFERGECFVPGDSDAMPNPVPPGFLTPAGGSATYAGNPPTGLLYQTPAMVATVLTPPQVFTPPNGPQVFGGIGEPHTPYGSRLQMTYREDDFGLSYTNPNDMNIDVEQMHWATWNESAVIFDVFDRYTLSLGHSQKRPDVKFELFDTGFIDMMTNEFVPGDVTCELNCLSLFSGLSTTFDDNVLSNSSMTRVVADQRYVINPTNAFRSDSGFTYVPYPEFETTFTWRDSRLVSIDGNGNLVGIGGAVDPQALPIGDATANINSPWIDDSPILDRAGNPAAFVYPSTVNRPSGVYIEDAGDFRGGIAQDHDPIALPLLMDFEVFPDDTLSVGTGANIFQIGYVGPSFADPPPTANGYYNLGPVVVSTGVPVQCTQINWPFFRVYSFGGPDLNNPGNFIPVIPDQTAVANGGVVIDRGLGAIFDPVDGRAQTGPGDSHIHWAQIDLVRRVSMVTFGFFDTETPNEHALASDPNFTAPLAGSEGFPDLTGLGNGITSMLAITDPPILAQPGGTNVTIEFRGADSIPNDDLWDPSTNNEFDTRNNLANPNFACEAFRYSKGDIAVDPNPTPTNDPGFAAAPFEPRFNFPQQRPVAAGLTPYVVDRDLDTIRAPVTNFLPRFFNIRVVLENNINATPATSPALRSLGIIYRKGQ